MKDLQSIFDTYKSSIFEKDITTFLSLYDENVLIFDTWQQWSYEGISAWKEMVTSWFSGLGTDNDLVNFDEMNMEESNEMASITAIVKFTAVNEKGEELRYLQNRLSWVVKKKSGLWKIIHQHTSSPIDFETMKVILTK